MRLRTLLGGAITAMILIGAQGAGAQELRGQIEDVVRDYLAAHPDQIARLVADYLAKHPEALEATVAEVLKRRPATAGPVGVPSAGPRPSADFAAAIAANAPLLFSSPRQITLGNPDGDVTLVEFFDYSCGFCKRALTDMLTLLKDDPKLKIVLKEFPILGPGSLEAARVSIAVHIQDSGARYLGFHQALLGGSGPVTKERALAAAEAQGFDMARLARDIASDDVAGTLAENMKLAESIGVRGTPGYVIGSAVIPGAVGAAALQSQIATARGRTAN
jgi:protein-disulfide isomerase